MDYSPPGSSVHGIFQARILEWVAISFSMYKPASPALVKAHLEVESGKFRMREVRASEQAKSVVFLGNEISLQSKVSTAAAELGWGSHMNRHALSFGCLDYFMKLSTVTFPDSEAVTKISCGYMMNLQMSAAGLSLQACGNSGWSF